MPDMVLAVNPLQMIGTKEGLLPELLIVMQEEKKLPSDLIGTEKEKENENEIEKIIQIEEQALLNLQVGRQNHQNIRHNLNHHSRRSNHQNIGEPILILNLMNRRRFRIRTKCRDETKFGLLSRWLYDEEQICLETETWF